MASTPPASMAFPDVELGNLLDGLPDELLLHVFGHLDCPELLALSRVSRRLRTLALDHVLHLQRLQKSYTHLLCFLPQRPPLRSLQPPASAIYLTRTHVAARHLHFRLLSAHLNRSLLRRPSVSSLVNARILPKDCCRRDRTSGEIFVAPSALFERRRRLELEKFKEGLRVWLERKAREIKKRKAHVGGVGILVWKFTKRAKNHEGSREEHNSPSDTRTNSNLVSGLRRFWEEMGSETGSARSR